MRIPEFLLSKGFIRPSAADAAAPIFLVKNSGEKNQPCLDYQVLKLPKGTVILFPVMSWLLNQLKGCDLFCKD